MLYSTSIAQVKKKMQEGKKNLQRTFASSVGALFWVAAYGKMEEESDTLTICRI